MLNEWNQYKNDLFSKNKIKSIKIHNDITISLCLKKMKTMIDH